jgi:lipopolysaccharide/colanic/teichoic acid biosynthesis glycosyltransferase
MDSFEEAAGVFKHGSKVILRIKTGSGVILRLLFPRRMKHLNLTPRISGSNGEVVVSTIAAGERRGNEVSLSRDVFAGRVPPLAGPTSRAYAVCKGALDLSLALALLVLSAPVVALAMLLIKLTSRGPALYTQTRLGRDGKPFIIYKLRTMVHKCEKLTGARWSLPGDPRITSLGRFFRKTHVDELPQLWNVLRGDMSLVGPRPERPEFVPQLEQAIVHYRARLLVKPGVTGLAQVQLPPDTNLASVRIKLAYDLYYVQHATLWLDLRLIASTAFKMFGLPCGFLRCLFVYPGAECVEREYKQLAPEKVIATRVQSAG